MKPKTKQITAKDIVDESDINYNSIPAKKDKRCK